MRLKLNSRVGLSADSWSTYSTVVKRAAGIKWRRLGHRCKTGGPQRRGKKDGMSGPMAEWLDGGWTSMADGVGRVGDGRDGKLMQRCC